MTYAMLGSRFIVGQLVITPGASCDLQQEDVLHGLIRHTNGDWGEMDEFDREQNERAVYQGGRLMSRYISTSGTVFWIITEHDRSVTTILLPAEY